MRCPEIAPAGSRWGRTVGPRAAATSGLPARTGSPAPRQPAPEAGLGLDPELAREPSVHGLEGPPDALLVAVHIVGAQGLLAEDRSRRGAEDLPGVTFQLVGELVQELPDHPV